MKKYRRYLSIGLVALSLFLSGCGTPMYELTNKEEELIVQHAAYFVAKHNVYQKDGVTAVIPEEEVESELPDTQEPDTEEPDTEKPDSENPGTENSGTQQPEKPTENTVTMAEAIGLEGKVEVSYLYSSVKTQFSQGSSYSVDAAEGCKFYVMTFALKNTTDAAIEVDILSANPTFKLKNDKLSVASEIVFLDNYLTTYKGTIGAGETVETILIFEVDEDKVEKITEPVLQITMDNKTKTVKL